MEVTGKLTPILYKYLKADKRQVMFFVQIILSLFIVQSFNLTKISEAINSNANIDSRYRRLQRFFSKFKMNYDAIAKIIYTIFDFSNSKYYLILDRTNWKFGKANINILFLCLSYKNIAVPVFWLVLNKQGNSSTRERCALINRFVKVFGSDNIIAVLGDREFIGHAWFKFLELKKLGFFIRVRKSDRLGNKKKVCSLFYNLPINAVMFYKNKTVNKIKVNITGVRLGKELLIIVTNKNSASSVEAYKERWQIETLFGCLKSKGFNFEDTHITKLERIKKVVAVLAITFSIAYIFGKWRHENIKEIKIKNHGRAQHSFFRYGLILIRYHIFTGKKLIKKISKLFDLLVRNITLTYQKELCV